MPSDWFFPTLAAFVIYAFLGWVVESAFRSAVEGRGFVNSGFLRGPVVPIYGFGALAITAVDTGLTAAGLGEAWMLKILAAAGACVGLEYLVGSFFEAFLKLKLWDYSNEPYNLHGRICLRYSLYWVLLAAGFLTLVRPAMDRLLAWLFAWPAMPVVAALAGAAVAVDAAVGLVDLKRTAEWLRGLKAALERLELPDPRYLASGLRHRLLRAFPNLRRIHDAAVAQRFAGWLEGGRRGADRALACLASPPESPAADPDYAAIVADIWNDPAVQRMGELRHHDSTTLRHSLSVSMVSYYLAKNFRLDAAAVARGALLHDFFLYDWRTTGRRHHPVTHPRTALRNARKRFALTPIEQDIIATHMWPIGKPFYAYPESFLVSSVDKLVSAREAAAMLRQAVARRLARRRYRSRSK